MEVWKPIPDYEGLYEASDEGQVRSLDRMVAQLGAKTKSIKGKSLRAISNDYSQVTYSTIKRINQGKIWASVGALL